MSFSSTTSAVLDAMWQSLRCRLLEAFHGGVVAMVSKADVLAAEAKLPPGETFPAELWQAMVVDNAGDLCIDICGLFDTSLDSNAGTAPAGRWLWDTGVQFPNEDAMQKEACVRMRERGVAAVAGDDAAVILQGCMLLGYVEPPMQVVLVLTGEHRGEVWVLCEAPAAGAAQGAGAGTGAAAGAGAGAGAGAAAAWDKYEGYPDPIQLVPLWHSPLASCLLLDCGSTLSTVVSHALNYKLGSSLALSLPAPLPLPVARRGPRFDECWFQRLPFWARYKCPEMTRFARTVNPFSRSAPNPSRPCEGLLVTGLPDSGECLWDTICALNIGLVVTMLPLPLTTAGPASAAPGVPTPLTTAAFAEHSAAQNLVATGVRDRVTPEEIDAVQYAVNFRSSRSTKAATADIVRRCLPEEFAMALRAAVEVRGVVFLHLPTADAHVLHSSHVRVLVEAAQAAWNRKTRVWTHCWAGVFRSYLAALVIMQRCLANKYSSMPLLDPRRAGCVMPEDASSDDDSDSGSADPDPDCFLGFGGAAAAALARPDGRHMNGVLAVQLETIQAAAALHCRCSPLYHYTWMILSHPELKANQHLCLAPEATFTLEQAQAWVAGLDSVGVHNLHAAYELEGLNTGVWEWIARMVARTVARLPQELQLLQLSPAGAGAGAGEPFLSQ